MLPRLTLGVLGAAALLAGCTGILGCTGDFDAYDFSGNPGGSGGNAATGAASSGGSGATGNASSGGGGNASGGNAATGGGGAGTGGGGGASVLVECGIAPCDVAGGAVCCVDLATEAAACEADGKCAGGELEAECDGPEDCPGEVCCATEKGGNLDKLVCKSACGGNDETVCHVGDDSPCGGGTCDAGIVGGYSICD